MEALRCLVVPCSEKFGYQVWTGGVEVICFVVLVFFGGLHAWIHGGLFVYGWSQLSTPQLGSLSGWWLSFSDSQVRICWANTVGAPS